VNEKQDYRVTRRQLAGSIFWGIVSIVFGWTLFAYWWAEVLAQDQPRPLYTMLLVLFVFAVVVLAGTFIWIWHNRRIASRGNRGRATRYTKPHYARDAVGREIEIPAQDIMRGAEVIRIRSTPSRKLYMTGEDSAA
jgi:hypothetical protein